MRACGFNDALSVYFGGKERKIVVILENRLFMNSAHD